MKNKKELLEKVIEDVKSQMNEQLGNRGMTKAFGDQINKSFDELEQSFRRFNQAYNQKDYRRAGLILDVIIGSFETLISQQWNDRKKEYENK